jgi:hypothetical protein
LDARTIKIVALTLVSVTEPHSMSHQ